MILLILAILTVGIAYLNAKFPLKFNPLVVEIARWAIVAAAWFSIGGLLNGLAVFFISQALYVPTYNYFLGRDIWFIDNDSWIGKQVIKYLGEGAGQAWFFIQLILGIFILLV